MLGVERHESQIASLENWLVRAPSGPMRDISSRETTLPYSLRFIFDIPSLQWLLAHVEASFRAVHVCLCSFHLSYLICCLSTAQSYRSYNQLRPRYHRSTGMRYVIPPGKIRFLLTELTVLLYFLIQNA